MKRPILAVLVSATLALPMVPATAQTTIKEVATHINIRARNGRLVGRVVAPFDIAFVPSRKCEARRRVFAYVKKSGGGFKRFARLRGSSEGKFKVRPPKKQGIYKIKAPAKKFSFANTYGVLKEGKCMPASVTGKLKRGKFTVLSRTPR